MKNWDWKKRSSKSCPFKLASGGADGPLAFAANDLLIAGLTEACAHFDNVLSSKKRDQKNLVRRSEEKGKKG